MFYIRILRFCIQFYAQIQSKKRLLVGRNVFTVKTAQENWTAYQQDASLHCGSEYSRIQTEVLGHLLAHSLACSAALTPSLARSLCSLPRLWESEFLMSQNDLVLSHSAVPGGTL